ncbi:ribonuclease T2 family protein [Granulicella tundricola]|uniref:Ribonuclease T2 n=1 Tax=Granulicella tundricola (strain ATCC BAA-1859 / DSM 23138 / MP5ACTX9) TaxID=1198114 RepID=E8X3X3_GRATM|nr:ribonuclease T [Granulicella tundricola]ADW70481.1 ribonuclease T2 [Granulicella tundricola MP5ACTX9]
MKTLTSLACLFASLLVIAAPANAQKKGKVGVFDFYLLNLSWSPEFCAIEATSPECKAKPGFIVHGLWPQNNNGSYPVSCSNAPGPKNYSQYLDISPDLTLLEHEWPKHGTCTGLGPDAFFQLERTDFHAFKVPAAFKNTKAVTMTPAAIQQQLQQANPTFPAGSILVSCSNKELTAVEACLAKDGVTPTVCKGLSECAEPSITILPQGSTSAVNKKPVKR